MDIKISFKIDKRATETLELLKNAYYDDCLSKSQVF